MNAKLEQYKLLLAQRNELNEAIAKLETDNKYSSAKLYRAVIYIVDAGENTLEDYETMSELIKYSMEDQSVTVQVESCDGMDIAWGKDSGFNHDSSIENYQAYFK